MKLGQQVAGGNVISYIRTASSDNGLVEEFKRRGRDGERTRTGVAGAAALRQEGQLLRQPEGHAAWTTTTNGGWVMVG